MRSLQTIGEVRLDERKFGIFRRSARSWPARRRSTNGGGSSGLSKTPNRTRLGWKRRGGGGVPLGYQQITAATLVAATGLTVPSGASIAFVSVDTAPVRWRDDGTAPIKNEF